MHISIPKDAYCEFVNIEPINNTLWARCQIKVCYVSNEPNRNGSIITKEVARNMANSLPGCPIVGFYNKDKQDFEGHNRIISISGDNFTIEDATKAYGFVDLNPKVWFQTFIDDREVEREYLMTEGVIWIGIYPEAERILTKGNNQSMELDEETLKGYWALDDNSYSEFFIINDALISKLCILGEDVEPCFEGAQITSFSLAEDFKAQLFSLIENYKNIVKGGKDQMILPSTYSLSIDKENAVWVGLYNEYSKSVVGVFVEEDVHYVLFQQEDKYFKRGFTLSDEGIFSFVDEAVEVDSSYIEDENVSKFNAEEVEAYTVEEPVIEEPVIEEPIEEPVIEEPVEEPVVEEPTFSVEEHPDFIALRQSFEELTNTYNTLVSDHEALTISHNELQTNYNSLNEEVVSLREFKTNMELAEKQAMIDSFSMLSDEDKDNVVKNINSYSLEDIEKELSVICFRKKVSFSQEPVNRPNTSGLTYNINTEPQDGKNLPDWVLEVVETSKKL